MRHRSSNPQPYVAVLPHLRRFETPDMAQSGSYPQEAFGDRLRHCGRLRTSAYLPDWRLAWPGTQKKKKKKKFHENPFFWLPFFFSFLSFVSLCFWVSDIWLPGLSEQSDGWLFWLLSVACPLTPPFASSSTSRAIGNQRVTPPASASLERSSTKKMATSLISSMKISTSTCRRCLWLLSRQQQLSLLCVCARSWLGGKRLLR